MRDLLIRVTFPVEKTNLLPYIWTCCVKDVLLGDFLGYDRNTIFNCTIYKGILRKKNIRPLYYGEMGWSSQIFLLHYSKKLGEMGFMGV